MRTREETAAPLRDVNVQASKGLKISTRCAGVDEFITAYNRFFEDCSIFIPHASRPVGSVTPFSFDLTNGKPAFVGVGAVVEAFTTAQNRFGRAGILVMIQQLGRSSTAVFSKAVAARKQPRAEQTPAPVFARAMTAAFVIPEELKSLGETPEIPLARGSAGAIDPVPELASAVPAITAPPPAAPAVVAPTAVASKATLPTPAAPRFKVPDIVVVHPRRAAAAAAKPKFPMATPIAVPKIETKPIPLASKEPAAKPLAPSSAPVAVRRLETKPMPLASKAPAVPPKPAENAVPAIVAAIETKPIAVIAQPAVPKAGLFDDVVTVESAPPIADEWNADIKAVEPVMSPPAHVSRASSKRTMLGVPIVANAREAAKSEPRVAKRQPEVPAVEHSPSIASPIIEVSWDEPATAPATPAHDDALALEVVASRLVETPDVDAQFSVATTPASAPLVETPPPPIDVETNVAPQPPITKTRPIVVAPARAVAPSRPVWAPALVEQRQVRGNEPALVSTPQRSRSWASTVLLAPVLFAAAAAVTFFVLGGDPDLPSPGPVQVASADTTLQMAAQPTVPEPARAVAIAEPTTAAPERQAAPAVTARVMLAETAAAAADAATSDLAAAVHVPDVIAHAVAPAPVAKKIAKRATKPAVKVRPRVVRRAPAKRAAPCSSLDCL